MPDVWLSGRRSLKSTYLFSSIFFSWVSLTAGGMKGFINEFPGLLGTETGADNEDEHIPDGPELLKALVLVPETVALVSGMLIGC